MTGPAGSPPAISVDLGATNPNDGDKVSFTFNLPDGTHESIQLTASSATHAAGRQLRHRRDPDGDRGSISMPH